MAAANRSFLAWFTIMRIVGKRFINFKFQHMEHLIRLIIAYALVIMLWAAFSLALGKNGGNAPLVIFVISSILFGFSTYLLKITK
jgi:uncharacterized membrane protein YhhN